ncbi:12324_t:CDS:2 [Funneliformis geosporum]|uniref:12324_t:CDS:1 n=1 Tax=Funneliformis geosporum TaxID=1117311 RepID=A0A9W4SUQ8_9GLOM|nr:12324_t:CDS:2 [Funneliformis geosporum]
MKSTTGEQYIRTLAQYIRSNERRLTTTNSPSPSSGHLSGHKRSDSGGGSFSMTNLCSVNNPNKILVTLDPHHLYYLLARFSDLGFDVGAFEAVVDFKRGDGETLDIDIKDLETSSVTSSNSISSMSSAMSSLSLFSGWQGWYSAAQKNGIVPINQELQYIYRSFIKLTGLKLAILNQKKIDGYENWPNGAMLSMNFFKNLTHLEIYGLSPKLFDGWDILQEKVESLSLQQGSIDDIYELFVDAVVDSMKRRKLNDNKTITNYGKVSKEPQDLVEQPKARDLNDYSPDSILPQRIWQNLKQVYLSNNSLTFVASEPLAYINKVTHLDLSQNLLIAVPSGLSQLYNLQYLNLSNNMIESVTGIYKMLSNITRLELQNNRIENLCGLERLWSLEYVDIRENKLTDWAEVGRMTELREIMQIYVEGNPFTKFQPHYRVSIFTAFRENDKDIILDGTAPSYNERRQINVYPQSLPTSQKDPEAVLSNDAIIPSCVLLSDEQKPTIPVLKTKKSRKFHKRVVNLDGNDAYNSGTDGSDVASIKSSKSSNEKKKKKGKSAKKSSKTEPIPIKDISMLSGDEYRRKIEELRTEGGSAWLRVLSEMEYDKSGADRLREPPKLKTIVDQMISTRDRA